MLLQIRGFSSRDEVQDFLSNNSVIADPLEIKDMDKASERVRQAIDSGELICVYGDYDADGVTSTALLYSYLETVGANVTYYIPSRETEGYGMNKAAVDLLAEKGLHRKDCPSKFKSLSGVGVVFKLIMALEGEYCDTDMLLDNYADILSLGTIGDIVDLRGENRVFVKRGLERIKNSDRPGISALVQASGIGDKPLTAGRVSFTLVPRINAVGRLGSSGRSVSLLLTEDYDEAVEIAQTMTDDNTERREIENSIVSQIDEMIRDNPALARACPRQRYRPRRRGLAPRRCRHCRITRQGSLRQARDRHFPRRRKCEGFGQKRRGLSAVRRNCRLRRASYSLRRTPYGGRAFAREQKHRIIP